MNEIKKKERTKERRKNASYTQKEVEKKRNRRGASLYKEEIEKARKRKSKMEERKHQRKKEGCMIHLKRSRRKLRNERRGASLGKEEINIKIFSKRNTSIPNMHAYSLGPVITQPLTETPSSRHGTGTSRHYSLGAARPPERISRQRTPRCENQR